MASIAVIIPALNEAGNIGQLVKDVRASLHAKVIVVDNNSSDLTADEARQAGAQVVCESKRGYGYACAAGVASACQADILVFLDGDCSFSPAELPVLLAPIFKGQAEFVIGSRELGHIDPGAMPSHQRFGNWLTARMMNTLYGLSVSDVGPYRAIRRQILIEMNMREMTYGWPTEMMVKAARRGLQIVEVPVSYHSRRSGRSKVSGTLRGTILASWTILRVTLQYAWR